MFEKKEKEEEEEKGELTGKEKGVDFYHALFLFLSFT